MKRASEYRRLARISMGRQMGTMAATGFMRSMVDSLVGIVLMFVLFVGLVLLGIQTVALASSGYGAAVIILTLFALVITLLVVAAGALFWLLEGGLIQQAHHAVHGRKVSMTDLFSGFTGGLAWRLIVIGLFNLLMTLFFSVPYVIAVFVSSSADDFTLLEAGAVVGAYLWYMAGILLIFLLFGLAPYILVDQPHLGAVQCMKQSLILTKKRRFRLFCLCCSFIGWYILGGISYGIGMFWILPYVRCAFYHFYEDLKSEKLSGTPIL